MSTIAVTPAIRSGLTLTALFLMLAMAAVVGTALGFEHLGGYIPCKLCLEQRIPYYIGAPLMAVAALASMAGAPRWATRALLAAGGALMLWGLYMSIYHSGVEWGWWSGPTDCGAVAGTIEGEQGRGVLDLIDQTVPPSCNEAALRILGLSFAGWNVLASLALAAIAFRGALHKR